MATPEQTINADNEILADLVAQQSNETLADELAGTGKKPAPAAPAKQGPWGSLQAFADVSHPADALAGAAQGSTEQYNIDSRGINEALLTNPKAEIAAFDKSRADSKAKAAEQAQQKRTVLAQENQAKQIASSPWTQLGNALAEQYRQAEAPAQALMSGSQTAPAQQGASSAALGLLGESSGSPDAATLQGWAGAANAATAPVQAAMAKEGAAYAAEAGPISQAVMNYGQANALSVETAPEASWLQALASHVTSNLSYYGSIPSADVGVLEQAPGVAQALQQAGGYGGQSGSGLTPLQDISVNNGRVSVKRNPAGIGTAGSVPSVASGGVPGTSPHA